MYTPLRDFMTDLMETALSKLSDLEGKKRLPPLGFVEDLLGEERKVGVSVPPQDTGK